MSVITPSYFADPVLRSRLCAVVDSWLGTPFRHRANVRGAGADCVTFVAETLLGCGALDSYVFPAYSLDWSRHQTRSLVLEWLAGCPRMARVPDAQLPLPGDVACYKIGKCVHHCAVVLEPPVLAHAVLNHAVDLGRLDDSALSSRLACYYRPLPR